MELPVLSSGHLSSPLGILREQFQTQRLKAVMVGFLASVGGNLVVSRVQALRCQASCLWGMALECYPHIDTHPQPRLALARLHH